MMGLQEKQCNVLTILFQEPVFILTLIKNLFKMYHSTSPSKYTIT